MKIIRTVIMSVLFRTVIGFPDYTEVVHDEWTTVRPSGLDRLEWEVKYFNTRTTHEVVFGELGTSRHLKVTQTREQNKIDIYNGSTKNQLFILNDDTRRDRWFISAIGVGCKKTFNVQIVNIYLPK
jgi:hypothetical protein